MQALLRQYQPTKSEMARSLEAALRPHLRPGVALLSGDSAPLSLLIQWFTQSDVSHTVAYVGMIDGTEYVIQSMDYELTPTETDEGVYLTPLNEYLESVATGSAILALQPRGLDEDRFVHAAQELVRHAPTFPSTCLGVLALLLLTNHVAELGGWADAKPRERLVEAALDGIERMHCSEAVARLWILAGVQLDLEDMALQRQVDVLDSELDPRIHNGVPRIAQRGVWRAASAPQLVRMACNAPTAAMSFISAVKERLTVRRGGDHIDLTMPQDLVEASVVDLIEFRPSRSGWKAI